MNNRLDKLQQAIEPLRQQVVHHQVYAAIENLNDLAVFMQHHVFAVWDFMSLLKSLQNSLTSTRIPWFPKGTADTRFLINEIVVGEESDVDMFGVRKSHYEIYLDAMSQAKASTRQINRFATELKKGMDMEEAFAVASLPRTVQKFVRFTFKTIAAKKDHVTAAVFTFGREDLIPGMFFSLVNDLDKNNPGNINIFKYYLERHIEIDGDHHSQLALHMVDNLCGTDDKRWAEAEHAAKQALEMRIQLWDGVCEHIKAAKKQRVPAMAT